MEAIGLNEDEMELIIKRFKTALKGRKEYPNKNKTKGKRSCFKCGKTDHFIANCPNNDSDQRQEKSGKKEKKKSYRKAKGEAHLGKEWDSDCSSSDSNDEGLATSAFNKSSLPQRTPHLPHGQREEGSIIVLKDYSLNMCSYQSVLWKEKKIGILYM